MSYIDEVQNQMNKERDYAKLIDDVNKKLKKGSSIEKVLQSIGKTKEEYDEAVEKLEKDGVTIFYRGFMDTALYDRERQYFYGVVSEKTLGKDDFVVFNGRTLEDAEKDYERAVDLHFYIEAHKNETFDEKRVRLIAESVFRADLVDQVNEILDKHPEMTIAEACHSIGETKKRYDSAVKSLSERGATIDLGDTLLHATYDKKKKRYRCCYTDEAEEKVHEFGAKTYSKLFDIIDKFFNGYSDEEDFNIHYNPMY